MKLRYTVIYKVVYSFNAANHKEADRIAREDMDLAAHSLDDDTEKCATASILEEVHHRQEEESCNGVITTPMTEYFMWHHARMTDGFPILTNCPLTVRATRSGSQDATGS
jgi:hypothetical protein